jgi:RNA polymerase sigma-70 factor (ECF subfamily)
MQKPKVRPRLEPVRPVASASKAVVAPAAAPPRPAAPPLTAAEVFRQHAARIYNLAKRMLRNEADIDDVTQEVLLQVVRKLDSFRGESELNTWLHRVTVNAVLLHRRKHAPRLAREVQAPLENLDGTGRPVASGNGRLGRPDRRALDRELRGQIEEAIDRLPEIYRDIFVLADIEDLPNADIGAALGLSLPAVKSRLHRARLLLRDALAPHLPEDFPR